MNDVIRDTKLALAALRESRERAVKARMPDAVLTELATAIRYTEVALGLLYEESSKRSNT